MMLSQAKFDGIITLPCYRYFLSFTNRMTYVSVNQFSIYLAGLILLPIIRRHQAFLHDAWHLSCNVLFIYF